MDPPSSWRSERATAPLTALTGAPTPSTRLRCDTVPAWRRRRASRRRPTRIFRNASRRATATGGFPGDPVRAAARRARLQRDDSAAAVHRARGDRERGLVACGVSGAALAAAGDHGLDLELRRLRADRTDGR